MRVLDIFACITSKYIELFLYEQLCFAVSNQIPAYGLDDSPVYHGTSDRLSRPQAPRAYMYSMSSFRWPLEYCKPKLFGMSVR